MYEQLNLFNTVSSEKKKDADPFQKFDQEMKRYWHYMETKGMNEQWIETAPGELRIIIDALADYYDMAGEKVNAMEGYARAVWENRLEKIKKIQAKMEDSIGYSRDRQLDICMKRRAKKNDDIGEDALVLMAKKKG